MNFYIPNTNLIRFQGRTEDLGAKVKNSHYQIILNLKSCSVCDLVLEENERMYTNCKTDLSKTLEQEALTK